MGQSRHPGPRRGAPRRAPALLAPLALIAALLSGCGTAGASAVTTLRSAAQVEVLTPGGVATAGRTGEVIRAGDVVSTGAGGSAILDTGGRLTWLAAGSQLTVRDGADQSLSHGSMLCDARSGPPLTIRVGSLQVRPQPGSAVRVESTFATRVGVLVGAARVRSLGREVTVPALRQLLATALALPSGPLPPLQLLDDRAEKSVAPALVADDQYLQAEGRELDSGAVETAALISAARHAWPQFAPDPAAPASESLLPFLIARAAGGSHGLAARYAQALRLRLEGGSWGVVAHLVGASALRTTPVLARLLLAAGGSTGGPVGWATVGPGSGTGRSGSAPAAAAGATPAPVLGSGGGGSGGGSGGGGSGGGGSGGGGGSTGGGSGGSGGSSGTGPSPSPSPSGTTQQLVDTVQSLMPSLTVSPSPTASLSLP